jgi:hypothetical protein
MLSTKSKVSSQGFYESFTSNKRCNLYVRDNALPLQFFFLFLIIRSNFHIIYKNITY